MSQIRFRNSKWTLLTAAATALICSLALLSMPAPALSGGSPPAGGLAGFAALAPIDAHIHIYKDDPALGALMQQLNLHILNVLVIDDRDPYAKGIEPQRADALQFGRSTGGRSVLCTTFSPYEFEQPGFAERANRQLDADFDAGAVAVKIYKVMGMEMKSKAGKWVFAADPAFTPVYQHIAARNRTVLAHLAEPDSCWQAPNPASPDYDYYKQNPQEYAYAHPDWPSKAAILEARDRVLAQNPKLRLVGAHLGSMETDVNEIAKRLDRYPNFAVDTAARVPYFMLQARDKVRAFLIKYQDRVLYATDVVVMPKDDTAKAAAFWRENYERDWKFFSTDQSVEYMGHGYKGLALPAPVLRKIFHDNAVKWYPGLIARK